MHIAILAVLHEPFDKRVFHKEAKSLTAAGHQVTYVCPSETDVSPRDGVAFVRIPVELRLRGRLRNVFRLTRAARDIPADVYMAVEPESWVAALGLKIRNGTPVVFDVHEYIPSKFSKFFPAFLRPLIVWLTIRAMRLFARCSNAIILTKASLDREFAGLRIARTVVLNTNHLQPRCNAIDPALLERFARRPTIIHQGQFGVQRGAYQLIEAMPIILESVPDCVCILLGPYAQGNEAAFQTAVREAGLEDVIVSVGTVPFEEVDQYQAVSKVGLILFQPIGLEHTLGMPHKMFDYMRAALPFVAPEYMLEMQSLREHGECALLIDVTDPRAIADAVVRLLRDEGLAKRLGETGRKLVETTYNWGYDEARLLSVFDRLAQKASAS